MQKIFTIRASQKDLEKALAKFVSLGWHVLNATKGSEWGRIGASYKWTIILDIGKNAPNADALIEEVIHEFSSKSLGKTVLLCIGVLVGLFALIAISIAIALL